MKTIHPAQLKNKARDRQEQGAEGEITRGECAKETSYDAREKVEKIEKQEKYQTKSSIGLQYKRALERFEGKKNNLN